MKKILISLGGILCIFWVGAAFGLDLNSALTSSQQLLNGKGEIKAKSVSTVKEDDDELILRLNKKGLTIHKTRSDFSPDKAIRRDEAAKMLTLALIHLPQPISFAENKDCTFSDEDQAWSDLKAVLMQSCAKGLFKGNKGKFNPQLSITNGQIMTVLGRMLFGQQDEGEGHYATRYVQLLEQKGYLPDSSLSEEKNRDLPATRATLAKLLGKVLKD